MDSFSEYIESGVLELYVLGDVSQEKAREIELLAAKHAKVRSEINLISQTLEKIAMRQAVPAPATVKLFVFATIDYIERLKSGEKPTFPPTLNKDSTIENYAKWLNRDDMVLSDDFEAFHAKIIGHTPEAMTAIVWLEFGAPAETHTDEFERFLIVEGTCEIAFGDEVHYLKTGDFLQIPLFLAHTIKVTSDIPCKVILQRVAA